MLPYTTLVRAPKAAPLPARQQTALQWTMRRCGGAFRCGRYQSAVSSAYIVQFVIPHAGKREKVPAFAGWRQLTVLPRTRSEERRVGTECVRKCRSRWWPFNKNKKLIKTTSYDRTQTPD